ncbi:MAG: NAD-dependent dehydratase [Planctomycetota bacterium]|nr:MAG: NAD-dependent dehydratase [Planctomycetota bacterium]
MTLHLVTGGTGYLGRHLVAKLLAGGKQVRVLARASSDVAGLDGAEIVRGDITDRAAVESALDGVERVFHVAAETRDGQPADVYDKVNHKAVTQLLELASERDVKRLVHTSHFYAIGRSGEPRSAPDFVNDEYWTHDPGDIHDAQEESKYAAENSLNQRVSLSEPRLALIPTMMYGPELRDVSSVAELAHGNRIVRMLADHAAGKYPGIPGDGSQRWNLTHVEDVAAAHVTVMDAGDEGEWPPPRWTHWHYLCAGDNVSVKDLFARFGKLAGVGEPKSVMPRRGLSAKLLGATPKEATRSPERFLTDLHWWQFTPAMAEADWGYAHRPLDEGLEQTVAWMRSSGLIG